jgi:undecaprenyl phosphate N,N'-diacetylbacillosamine 1-phosphate transferase
MYSTVLKRMLDVIISGLVLVLCSPVIILIAFILRLYNGQSGAFFLQDRPGKNEKIFKVIKFKTMTDKRDEQGNLLPSMQRVTKFGSFIRNYSLDELPQLVNVFKGDMSIVGPRPLLVQYLDIYTDLERRRHHVRPGITGWAQVNGRNTISWKKKFELDIYYVKHVSLYLDMKIILMTIKKVISRNDINKNESQTVETYNGKN